MTSDDPNNGCEGDYLFPESSHAKTKMRSSRREPWERGCFFSILDLGEGEDGSKFQSILSKTVAFLVACVQTFPISFVARVQQRK